MTQAVKLSFSCTLFKNTFSSNPGSSLALRGLWLIGHDEKRERADEAQFGFLLVFQNFCTVSGAALHRLHAKIAVVLEDSALGEHLVQPRFFYPAFGNLFCRVVPHGVSTPLLVFESP